MNLYQKVQARINHSKEVTNGTSPCDCYVVPFGVMGTGTAVRFSNRCPAARRFTGK